GIFKPEEVLKYDVDAVLLDAYSSNGRGGTGETFNWDFARRVLELHPKMYLAGGLSPENVANAVAEVKPYAVDACSLLEGDKGRKDARKLKSFFDAVSKQL
ncbi:MAG: N-(5'-phosphoribosyl)anthranilate isomerase, partial [Blastocatellia bacterium]|nr:N-(5'-phosphoribosyl)anthranilate isomerase [Blastocatellia bacterium]